MFFVSSKHPTIYLDRLTLREPRYSDVTDVFAFCSDPASSKYADWHPHSDKNETRSYISWLKKRNENYAYTWVIELESQKKVVGTISIVGMDYSRRIATVGYTLNRDYQHQGLATEALKGVIRYLFEELFVERVQAKVIPQNEASIKLLERVGMKCEGLLRRGAYCKTACVDVYVYAMTVNDYRVISNKTYVTV